MTKNEEKHAGGRPRKYESVEQLQAAIEDYFKKTDKLTITGLALHLGFCSRQALINYEGYSKEFYDAIKRAKTKVEQYYEEHLVKSNAAGAIFALKNFKWTDKQELDLSGAVGVNQPSMDAEERLEWLKGQVELLEAAKAAGTAIAEG